MKIACVYIRDDKYVFRSMRHDPSTETPLGMAYISAALKSAGHDTEVFTVSSQANIKKIFYNVARYGLFAVSVAAFSDWRLSAHFAKQAKKNFPNAKIILGGICVTLMPDEIFADENIDAICIGEGEAVVARYAEMVANNKYEAISGLWIKTPNGVLKSSNVAVIANLDTLPYPDREGFSKSKDTDLKPLRGNKDGYYKITLTRGCKGKCIYCATGALSGELRYRSPESVLGEVKYLKDKYGKVNAVFLEAETFLDIEKLKQLCCLLKEYNESLDKKINFKLRINFAPSFLDDDIITCLRQANVDFLVFGVESGCLQMRKFLKRPHYTNEQIVEFCARLSKAGIKPHVNIMYCHPFETAKSFKETLNFLKAARPDSFSLSRLTPMPGTELYAMKYKKKWFSPLDFLRVYTLRLRVYLSYKSFRQTINLMLEPFFR
ncbi:MAG: B12-binding domain-containing radical SAM protein [Elusimicrobia bacterium]|nr:B12-binding domain-containing radical SAM protein [Elusimicrobiota bacterium]